MGFFLRDQFGGSIVAMQHKLRQTSAADLKFLHHLLRVGSGISNR
jgi:hypothetical protein